MIKPLVAAIPANLVVGCVKPIIRADETPLSLWQKYYPQAIEFSSIIDQAINEEWPQ